MAVLVGALVAWLLVPLRLCRSDGDAGAACPSGAAECALSDSGGDGVALLQRGRNAPAVLAAEGSNSVGVFVMMSLTMVDSKTGKLSDPAALRSNLTEIKKTGAVGVMTDVWWGITEPTPKGYNFDPYRQLVDMLRELGLKVQFVTSFHQCGTEAAARQPGNCYIPLPAWVRKQPGIWFKNALGDETKAYISLFADDVRIEGRTPVQLYEDWMVALRDAFQEDISAGVVSQVMVGMGTDGELKYPSYENGPWTFPGIGMFQAFDQHALASLARAVKLANAPASWAEPPCADVTGNSNSFPNQTEYFSVEGGGWTTDQAKFFLDWYSGALIRHGNAVLAKARQVFGPAIRLSGKISGVHWWYKYPSHAAELTAGYYNANGVDGYGRLAEMFKKTGDVIVDFTCLEMTDASQPPYCDCGPQELVLQVQSASKNAGVPFTGENALTFYTAEGYDQMVSYKPPTGFLQSVTYMRVSNELLQEENLRVFSSFVSKMQNPLMVTPWTVLGTVAEG